MSAFTKMDSLTSVKFVTAPLQLIKDIRNTKRMPIVIASGFLFLFCTIVCLSILQSLPQVIKL